MTKKEFDLIGSMNMCDEISNEAYKKIMVYCEEQEPCKDAISREEVLNILKAEWVLDKPIEEWSVYRDVTDLPAVTPIRPKGGWIVREDNTSFVSQIPRRWVECSHCGWSFSYDRIKDDFCSKCGADMRGEEEENKCK